jgi:hypothetical protein
MKWQDAIKQLNLSLVARDARIRDLETDVQNLKIELLKAKTVHKVEKS